MDLEVNLKTKQFSRRDYSIYRDSNFLETVEDAEERHMSHEVLRSFFVSKGRT